MLEKYKSGVLACGRCGKCVVGKSGYICPVHQHTAGFDESVARGRNAVARAILEAGLDKALENDMKTMFLEVRVSNHGAQNLYKNFGFHVDCLRKSVYELPVEDGYIMSR